MTINKSQGQTLNQVAAYLSRLVFSHGQLYIALSRVSCPSKLKVLIYNRRGVPTYITKNVVYKMYDANYRWAHCITYHMGWGSCDPAPHIRSGWAILTWSLQSNPNILGANWWFLDVILGKYVLLLQMKIATKGMCLTIWLKILCTGKFLMTFLMLG